MSSRALGFCVMGSGRTKAGEAAQGSGGGLSQACKLPQAMCVVFARQPLHPQLHVLLLPLPCR